MMRSSLLSSLAILGAVSGCSGTDAQCTTPSSGMEAKYVANTLTVPQQRSDYAMDLNGDGRADNQLGNIIGALTGAGLNTRDGVNTALADGNVVLLVDETGADL